MAWVTPGAVARQLFLGVPQKQVAVVVAIVEVGLSRLVGPVGVTTCPGMRTGPLSPSGTSLLAQLLPLGARFPLGREGQHPGASPKAKAGTARPGQQAQTKQSPGGGRTPVQWVEGVGLRPRVC